jgi:D-xylose transport system permease protein
MAMTQLTALREGKPMSDIVEKKNEVSTTSSPASQSVVGAAVEVPSYMPRRTLGQRLRGELGFVPVLLTLLVIMTYFQIDSGGLFLSSQNVSNLAGQIPTATGGILGLGVIMVLLLGEIDLSIAVVATLCSIIMAVLSERVGAPAWVAISAALLSGALIGLINGFFVAVVRVPSFIVTLAGSIGYSGLLLYLLQGQATLIINNSFIVAIAGSPDSFLPNSIAIGLAALVVLLFAAGLGYKYVRRKRAGLRTSSLLWLTAQVVIVAAAVGGAVAVLNRYNGIPYSTAIFFGLIALFWLIMTKTPFGRHVYAVGGGSEAARRAGISVTGIRIACFTLCSTLAAVSGIIAASHTLSVASQIPITLLLDAIAAAVIGGVSLFGGRGSVWAVVLGVLIIGSLENGLALKSAPTEVTEMVEGVVLLIAVTADALLRRAQMRTGR